MSQNPYEHIIKYVTTTPENTNGNVLKTLLENTSGGDNLDDFISGKMRSVTSNLEIIPDYAFAGKSGLEEVNLPNVIYIGRHAFSNKTNGYSESESSSESESEASGDEEEEGSEDLSFNNRKLRTVNMDSVTHIEEAAFKGDENLEITELPDSLMVVEKDAFKDCPKVQLTRFPRNIVHIEDDSFDLQENIDLSTLPNTIEYLGIGLLVDYDAAYNNNFYNSRISELEEYLLSLVEDGILKSDFPVGWWNICSMTPQYGSDSDGVYRYKERLNEIIRAICPLITKAYFPNGTKTIPYNTFYNYYNGGSENLIYVEIPDKMILTSSTFQSCSNLRDVVFNGTDIIIPGSCFSYCSDLTNINLSNVIKIEGYAFQSCNSLESNLIFSENLLLLGSGAFSNAAIKSVEFLGENTTIESSAFSECNYLNSVILPSNLNSISDSLFYNCSSLSSIDIPNSVTAINSSAFNGCSSLNNISIPDGVTYIGPYAFNGCSSLDNISFPQALDYLGAGAIYDTPYYTNLPDGLIYISNWLYGYKGSLSENMSLVIEENTRGICDNAFKDVDNKNYISSVSFQDGFEIIGENAFDGCTGITSLTFNNGLETIGASAFMGCTNITSLEFPNSLEEIADQAFKNNTSLEEVSFNNNLKRIGNSAFENTKIREININAQQCIVSNTAFNGNTYLENVSLKIKEAGSSNGYFSIKKMFKNCSNLTSINLEGMPLTFDSEYSNYNLNKLEQVNIPEAQWTIHGTLFYNLPIKKVIFGNINCSIGRSLFTMCSYLTYIDMTNVDHVIPLENSSYITSGISNNYEIIFANQEMLDLYANATNWSYISSHFKVAQSEE